MFYHLKYRNLYIWNPHMYVHIMVSNKKKVFLMFFLGVTFSPLVVCCRFNHISIFHDSWRITNGLLYRITYTYTYNTIGKEIFRNNFRQNGYLNRIGSTVGEIITFSEKKNVIGCLKCQFDVLESSNSF